MADLQDFPNLVDPATTTPAPIRSYALQVLPSLSPGDTPPLLYAVLGTGTPPWKWTGVSVRYTDRSSVPGQSCGNCRHSYQHVTSSRYICDQIRPDIRPSGWCSIWKAP